MKIKVLATIQCISGSLNQAVVKVGASTFFATIPEGEKPDVLRDFSQGRATCFVDLDVSEAIINRDAAPAIIIGEAAER